MQTRLAFVSKTPGRTQHINYFHLRSGALLADLPGYGYAKVPEAMRLHWQQFLARYLAERQTLAGMVLVMDVRHAFTELDHRMLEWFLPTGRSLHILLTKADKLTHSAQRTALRDAHAELAKRYTLYAAQLRRATVLCNAPSRHRRSRVGSVRLAQSSTLEKEKAPASRGVTRGLRTPCDW